MAEPSRDLVVAVNRVAAENGWDPVDLMTAIGYETAGTYDPWQKGPTTRWGEHRGLIQWGEPQRQEYGVSQNMPVGDQVDAVAAYLRNRGLKPGQKGLLPMYAAINAGNVTNVNASDEAAGGVPGTVREKVASEMMNQHRAKAAGYLGVDPSTLTPYVPPEQAGVPEPETEQPESWMTSDIDVTGNELVDGLLTDARDTGLELAKDAAINAVFGTGGSGVQAPPPPPPPPMRQVAPQQPVMFKIKRKKENQNGR